MGRWLALSGCLLVGLFGACSTDNFTGDGGTDSGGDASIPDVAVPDPPTIEGSLIDATSLDAGCGYADATSSCGCNGPCCVTGSTIYCGGSACGGATLGCVSQSDCNVPALDGSVGAPFCCLDNVIVPDPTCPVGVSPKATSTCVAFGGCEADGGRYRLCTDDGACGAYHCKQAVIQGTSFYVGICL